MTNHQSADNQHELEQEMQQEDVVDEVKEQGEDPLEEAIARVQELEAQLAETSKKEQDLLLRTRAEIDNIRRRTEQDIEKAHKFALEKFAKDILNTIDNLERALATSANTEDESVKALFDGVKLTL
ncbi:molecular chaperone GrpE, partial [Aggregatibacter actinomycetemcomitans serotype e str. SC936]